MPVAPDRRAAGGDRGAQPRPASRDHAVRVVSTFGIGFPPFWLGLMLIILFSVELGHLPGRPATARRLADKLAHLVLPCLTVALSLSTVLHAQPAGRMVAGA